jgi:hypothetical protein
MGAGEGAAQVADLVVGREGCHGAISATGR